MFNITTIYIVCLLYGMCNCCEVRDIPLYVNDDGSLQRPDTLPDCSTGKIDIIGYNYYRRDCHYSYGCRMDNKEQLSPAEEYHLHQMCSWRKRCLDGLRFPLTPSEQKQRPNAVNIKYTCSDAADVIVNMCTTATTYFNESLHVTINESVTNYQACECHLNNANFSVVINDLRLTSNVDEAICSPAEFMINSDQTFVCSQDSDHFNSVFHSKVIGSSANAFMAIKPNSRHVIPAMVLLTVNPEARARIECLGRKRRSDSANTAVTSADASPYTLSRTVVRTDVVTQSSTTAIQQRTSTPNPLTTASTSHATEPHATPGQRQDTDSLGTSLPSLIKDVAVIKTAVLSSLFLFAMTIVLTAWYFYQHPRKWNELKSHFSCWRNSRSSDVDYHQESHEASSDKSPNKTTNDKQSDDHHDEQDKLLDTSSILKISVEQPDDSRGEFVSLKSIKGKKRYNREELSTEADSLLETEGKRSYSIGSREPMPSNSNSSLTSPGDSSGISDINDIPDPALSPNSENKQK